MVGEIGWLGEKVFERRPFDIFHLVVSAIAGIEVVLEERAEVDLCEGIFLLCRSGGIFFVGRRGGAVAVFFFFSNFVELRNGIFPPFGNGVLAHFTLYCS